MSIGEESLRWFSAGRLDAETDASPVVARPRVELDVATLVGEYSGILYRVALSVVRNAAEAEDVVQDAFVRVLQHAGSLGSIDYMRPWLVRIAWNLALDRRRRMRPEQMDEVFAASLVAKTLAADVAVAEAQRIAAVLGEIERLPKHEREALLLSAMEELSMAEIGAVLKRSESSVRSLIFRARTRLRERLEVRPRKNIGRQGGRR